MCFEWRFGLDFWCKAGHGGGQRQAIEQESLCGYSGAASYRRNQAPVPPGMTPWHTLLPGLKQPESTGVESIRSKFQSRRVLRLWLIEPGGQLCRGKFFNNSHDTPMAMLAEIGDTTGELPR
jgi:hypothetical protein